MFKVSFFWTIVFDFGRLEKYVFRSNPRKVFYEIGVRENHIELSKHIDLEFYDQDIIPRYFSVSFQVRKTVKIKIIDYRLKIIDLQLFQHMSMLYTGILSTCIFLKVVIKEAHNLIVLNFVLT